MKHIERYEWELLPGFFFRRGSETHHRRILPLLVLLWLQIGLIKQPG